MSEQYAGGFDPDLADGQSAGEPIQSGGAGLEQPQTITRKDLEALAANLRREFQSATDKQENRIKKEFEKRLSERQQAYAALGIEMPEGERTAIARSVIESVREDGSQPAQAGPSPDLLRAAAEGRQELMDEYGVTIEPGDPEYAALAAANAAPSLRKHLAGVEAALKAKAERMKGGPTQPAAGSPAARAPMVGSGQAAGGDLAAQYRQEITAAKGKGANQYHEIRRRYRERGLDVDAIQVFGRS